MTKEWMTVIVVAIIFTMLTINIAQILAHCKWYNASKSISEARSKKFSDC